MNKKICSLICFMLILGAIIPVAFAGKPDKGPLEKIVLEVMDDRRYGRPDWAGPPEPEPEPEGEYELMGVKWPDDTSVTYCIDVSGSGLEEEDVVFAISASAEEWDDWTSAELFGAYTVISDGSWDKKARDLDGRNELVFGNYRRGVIAVAIVWSNRYTGYIVEFDIMFNTDYTWGDASIDDTVMDLQNIATHELGHGVGLGDLYDSANWEKTMYGYSDYGEIMKRDLHEGDIAGIQELYGSIS